MYTRTRFTCFVFSATLLTLALASTGCGRDRPPTPEESRARGDALLREMSTTLGKASAITVDVDEMHERVRRNGQKASATFTRKVTMRRPDRLAFHQAGAEHEFDGWYDGRTLTIVGQRQRIFVRTNVPPTLDDLFDRLAERYDMPMPMADLLHTSAYDSLVGQGSTGGWTGRSTINGRQCEQLKYAHEAVDFTLDLSSSAPVVPCRMEVVDKRAAARPVSRLTFSNWNLAPKIEDSAFAAVVPADYEEIPMVERFSQRELTKPSSNSQPAPARRSR